MNCFLRQYILVLTILVAAVFGGDWPTFRGSPERTGYYPDAVGFPSAKPEWTFSARSTIISSPSVSSGIIYFGSRDSTFYALNTGDGSIEWSFHTRGWVDVSPHVQNGMVIFSSRDGNMYVADASNGAEIARTAVGLALSSPVLGSGGAILTGLGPPFNGFGTFELQVMPRNVLAKSWSTGFSQMSYSSPARWNSYAVIGANNGKLFCLNTRTHDSVWSIQTGGNVYLSTPAISDTTVYFAPGGDDKSVYAVDVQDGLFFWRSAGTPPSVLYKGQSRRPLPEKYFRELLRLSPEGRERAVQWYSGKGFLIPGFIREPNQGLAKRTAAGPGEFYSYGSIKTSSVAVGPDNVYVVQKELGYPQPKFTLLALNKYTGAESWRYSELRNGEQVGYCSSPVITKNLVFCGWGEGALNVFKRETGELLRSDTLDGHIISSPALSDGNLFVATTRGTLYKFSLAETDSGVSFQKSTFCYPNPAREGVSKLQVFVQHPAVMDIVVYNVLERPVFRLHRNLKAGEKFTYGWKVKGVANGVYFALVKVRYAGGTSDRKILKIAVLN